MKPGQEARRYMTLSTYITVKELVKKIASITGRHLPVIQLPGWSLLGPLKLLDKMQLLLPFRLPFCHDLVCVPCLDHRIDDSLTRKDFNLAGLDIDKTIADTINWIVNSGGCNE